MFPQGTHGWAWLGSEPSLDETEVFPLWSSIYTLESQRPWEGYNHTYVFSGLCFMNLVGEEGQKHRTRLDFSESQQTVSWVPSTRLQNQVLMLFTSHLWRRNRGKSFWTESNVFKGSWESHGARWNKSHYLFLCSICSLAFLLLRISTWR